ncbi:MAG: U32 family peptidase [Clostridiales bacterium]|nr:U32 family peptidase [Clostridiales bacterium]
MIKTDRKTELLSPAGSFESAKAAVNAGADAVYMGGSLFSARAFAESSSSEEDMLMQAIEYCHLRGVRVYMTLNTLLKQKEMLLLEEYLRPYVENGLDGVIVQDSGVFFAVRELFPGLELHVSTQAAVTGSRTVQHYLNAGAKRIVLARELSLKEIRDIYERTGAELEVFAHGALCYSYSGCCLMSSFIGGRSGNRGKCAGTCRLAFDAFSEDGAKLNRSDEGYLLSMYDLNTLERLPEMIEAGVYSFKIEGRMKSPLYTAAVTSVYRKYLDKAEAGEAFSVDSRDQELLREVFDRSREGCGYLDGKKGREMLTLREKPVHRQRNEALIEMLRKRYIDTGLKVPVEGRIELRTGREPELTLRSGSCEVRRTEPFTIQRADSRPLTRQETEARIGKFGGTDFELKRLEVLMDDNCFVPNKVLNELRRQTADELKRRILESGSRK